MVRIERSGKIEAIGRDPEYPGLFVIKIPLNEAPNTSWIECFKNPTTWTPSVHPPSVSGNYILLRSPENQIERDIEWILKWIEEANERYEKQLEKSRAERKRAEEKQALEAEKTREINERLAKL